VVGARPARVSAQNKNLERPPSFTDGGKIFSEKWKWPSKPFCREGIWARPARVSAQNKKLERPPSLHGWRQDIFRKMEVAVQALLPRRGVGAPRARQRAK
jgi:hypothetical protein